jgi:hypothetical protein
MCVGTCWFGISLHIGDVRSNERETRSLEVACMVTLSQRDVE